MGMEIGGLTGVRAANGRLSPAQAHSIIRQRLERLAVLQTLEEKDVHHLAQQLHLQTYNPGELILPRGARADCLGLLVQGQVAVQAGQRRDARTEAILLPGSTFGEAMLMQGRPSTVTLQAVARCEIWFLHRADLQARIDERRGEQRKVIRRRMASWGGLLAAVCLVAILALSLPATRQALALAPMGVAEWCNRQQHESCAWRAWTLAARLAPANANPLLGLGNLYFERGEIGAAEQAFEAAKALSAESAEVYNNLGLIYAQQGEQEQAIAAFQEALELQPGTAAIEQNLALSLQALGRHDEALAHYQAALALGEPTASTLANLAIAYYDAGQMDKAAETAKEALRRDDRLAAAYAVLGAIDLEGRRPEEALPNLKRATEMDNGYSQAYFYLGLAYKSLNNPSEAIRAFERALATATDETTRVRIRRHLNELYQVESSDSSP